VRVLDPDAARRLRDRLDAAGFTFAALTERLGPQAVAQVAAGELAPLVRATRSGDALDVLLRLFVVGLPVTPADARAALGPVPVEELAAGGVVAAAPAGVEARITLRPLDGPEAWIVAHDRPAAPGTSLATDHVIGVSVSSMALAGATIRRPVAAALDLGTGCGIQALFAAGHSDRVVASDVNPRAAALASLTMALNGAGHVEVRTGDLLGPVAGETFGLVVANPPFVISPSERYLFRDGARPVDELCRTLVGSVPAHLDQGGHFQCLASWAHVTGEDWRDRLAGWFAGTGCDALVLVREAVDPATHAANWLRQTEPPDRWDPEYDRWMAYYEVQRIEAIGLGLVTMRRRPGGGEGWFRAEEAEQDFAMPCGDHLGAAFELADLLAALDDAGLAATHLRVAPDVVLDERATPAGAGWSVTDRRLRQTAGLCREGEVDGLVAAIVAACDGSRPLGAVLDEVARSTGADPGAVARAALPLIRRLVEQGFLLPALD
jgi:Methyltransferase small domain